MKEGGPGLIRKIEQAARAAATAFAVIGSAVPAAAQVFAARYEATTESVPDLSQLSREQGVEKLREDAESTRRELIFLYLNNQLWSKGISGTVENDISAFITEQLERGRYTEVNIVHTHPNGYFEGYGAPPSWTDIIGAINIEVWNQENQHGIDFDHTVVTAQGVWEFEIDGLYDHLRAALAEVDGEVDRLIETEFGQRYLAVIQKIISELQPVYACEFSPFKPSIPCGDITLEQRREAGERLIELYKSINVEVTYTSFSTDTNDGPGTRDDHDR